MLALEKSLFTSAMAGNLTNYIMFPLLEDKMDMFLHGTPPLNFMNLFLHKVVQLDQQELQVLQEHKVLQDLQELLVLLEVQELRDQLVQQELLEQLEPQAQQVLRVPQDLQDLLEPMGQMELMVQMVQLVQLVPQDRKVLQEQTLL